MGTRDIHLVLNVHLLVFGKAMLPRARHRAWEHSRNQSYIRNDAFAYIWRGHRACGDAREEEVSGAT